MNKDKLLQIRLTKLEYNNLKWLADCEGETVSNFVRIAIDEYIYKLEGQYKEVNLDG